MVHKSKIRFSALSLRFVFTIAMLASFFTILNGCKHKTDDNNPPPDGVTVPLRFVFMADSRGDTLKHPVNTEVLSAIITQISQLKPKPSFIVFGGDMSYRGYIDSAYTFKTWKNMFQSLTDNGMKLYTTMGNHELYHQHSSNGFLLVNQQQFQIDFSENPTNGPPGYDHLVYSFTDETTSSYFAVLDPYYITQDTVKDMGLGGNIDSVQMAWLKTQVAQSNALHKFLFIHTPYFYMSDDPDEPSSANQSFTRLWSFLDVNKFDMYACGHSHLFSRRTIVDTIPPTPQTTPLTPPWQNNVVQLLNGTCGAGPSTGYVSDTVRSLWNVHNSPKTYYFSVIDVIGDTVKVNSYSGYTGNYTIFDTFLIIK